MPRFLQDLNNLSQFTPSTILLKHIFYTNTRRLLALSVILFHKTLVYFDKCLTESNNYTQFIVHSSMSKPHYIFLDFSFIPWSRNVVFLPL